MKGEEKNVIEVGRKKNAKTDLRVAPVKDNSNCTDGP